MDRRRRERFDEVLAKLNIPRPDGRIATSDKEAMKVASELEFPLIVRPSYVLGGRAMEIVYNEKELERYLREAVIASPDHPILIDEYMVGREVEVDAVATELTSTFRALWNRSNGPASIRATPLPSIRRSTSTTI